MQTIARGLMIVNGEKEGRIAMALARRSYLYNLFHRLFAGAADMEMGGRLFCVETLDTLNWLSGLMILGEGLASESLALSRLTLGDCIEEAISCVARHADKKDQEKAVAIMGEDYPKLFQIPGDGFVRPWESPYVNPEGTLFCESTLDVRTFYHDAGLRLKEERRFPDDHIAAMMDYLGRTSQRVYESYADGDDVSAVTVLRTQKEFCRRHLLTWVDEFADSVVRNDIRAYYAAFAGAMSAFAHVDYYVIGQLEEELAA